MTTTAFRWLRTSISIIATVALSVGCANDALVGPDQRSAPSTPLALGAPGAAQPDLGACSNLSAPEGSTFAFHAYAKGVQIYRWDGGWIPVAPSAVLYADAEGKGVVGTHYAGPRWQSTSGSTVKGAVIDRCPGPDANAVPWLSLGATYEGGPGVFQHVTFIQRLNTTGGKAPSTAGSFTGQVKEVPYTAEYYFYRAP